MCWSVSMDGFFPAVAAISAAASAGLALRQMQKSHLQSMLERFLASRSGVQNCGFPMDMIATKTGRTGKGLCLEDLEKERIDSDATVYRKIKPEFELFSLLIEEAGRIWDEIYIRRTMRAVLTLPEKESYALMWLLANSYNEMYYILKDSGVFLLRESIKPAMLDSWLEAMREAISNAGLAQELQIP